MQTRASVKLVKTCQEAAEGACQQCSCRPMWCLTCMGKWFASRQDPQRPDTWLASRVPCPTCRARFCILDVCRPISPLALPVTLEEQAGLRASIQAVRGLAG